MKRLIVTGDDFGLAEPVNEAIIEAHRRGILTAASLLIGAPAAADAIEKARAVPSLKVGLHVAVVEGHPVLPPAEVPDLVDAKGEFPAQPVRFGFKCLFRSKVRKQLAKEIRAQYEAFLKSALPLDHVNAHGHMHLHPMILDLILTIGRSYGARAVRFPGEPPLRSWRAAKKSLGLRLAWWVFLSPWLTIMKNRLKREGMHTNDNVFGMYDSGAMTEELVLALLRQLPDGVTEMYFHPATRRCPAIERTMPGYRHEEEFKALTSPVVSEALKTQGIEKIAFSDI